MTKDLQDIINKVNNARTILSSRLSTLSIIEEQMRKLAAFDEWTMSQENQWMELEIKFKKTVHSLVNY